MRSNGRALQLRSKCYGKRGGRRAHQVSGLWSVVRYTSHRTRSSRIKRYPSRVQRYRARSLPGQQKKENIIALPWIRPAREFRLYRTLEQKVCELPEHRRRYRLSRLTNGSVPGLCVCHSDSIKSAAALAQSRDGKKSSTAESGQDTARRRQHPTRCWRHLTARRRHPTVYWRDPIACLEDAVRCLADAVRWVGI